MTAEISSRNFDLYASNAFLATVEEARLRTPVLDPQHTELVANMARAGEPIEDLGGIALLNEADVHASSSTDIVLLSGSKNEEFTIPDSELELVKLRDGREVARGSLGTFSERLQRAHKRIFTLVVPPDQNTITLQFYHAATHIPGKPAEGEWMREKFSQAGGLFTILGALTGPVSLVAGLAAGKGLDWAGGKLEEWRRKYNLSDAIYTTPPVTLRPYGELEERNA